MLKKRDLTGRVWLLDELRGLFILLMVLYHLCYDLVFIFGVSIPAFEWKSIQWLQLLIAGLFVFIAGVACHYSHNNVKRGLQCFCFGLAMTAVTYFVLPSQLVLFGILHFLGLSMLLFAFVWPLIKRVPPILGLLVCAALFFLTFNTQSGYWGMRGWEMELPRALYSTSFLFPLGFPGAAFWSSDYFPFLPWIFWFFGGAFAGVYVRGGLLPQWAYRPHSRTLAFAGRNTLIIYLLHQPVVYGVLMLLFYLLRSA